MSLIKRFRRWLNQDHEGVIEDSSGGTYVNDAFLIFDALVGAVFTLGNVFSKRKQGVSWKTISILFCKDILRILGLFVFMLLATLIIAIIIVVIVVAFFAIISL